MAGLAALGWARRRQVAALASASYALACAAGARTDHPAGLVMIPAVLTLAGYWLSGLFVGAPQPRVERWLLESDRRLFASFRIDRWLADLPMSCLEAIEFVYSTVYLVVVAGAMVLVPAGGDALVRYWSLVMTAELACCAALPFVRCRPPRSLEAPGVIARRSPLLRRLNSLIVERGSIRVNTIPSAHVAAALAAGLAVVPSRPAAGILLMAMSVLIGAAATLGRYHYAVDCVLGAGVAIAAWWLVARA
jgi:hypothetical protein